LTGTQNIRRVGSGFFRGGNPIFQRPDPSEFGNLVYSIVIIFTVAVEELLKTQ